MYIPRRSETSRNEGSGKFRTEQCSMSLLARKLMQRLGLSGSVNLPLRR